MRKEYDPYDDLSIMNGFIDYMEQEFREYLSERSTKEDQREFCLLHSSQFEQYARDAREEDHEEAQAERGEE